MEISHQIVYVLRVLFLLLLLLAASYALGEPVYEAKDDKVRVVIYTEACELKEVTNLPRRATWTENGKVTEGCFGSMPGLALFYWSDKTVVVIPQEMFTRVVGA